MDPDREWWLRVPAVLLSPRAVFTALRNEERDDLDARSEPVLALVLLAGVFAALTSGAAKRLYDDAAYDGPLVIALWPIELAVFGDDLFRRGGDDAGDAGTAFDVVELGFVLWSAALLVIGVR